MNREMKVKLFDIPSKKYLKKDKKQVRCKHPKMNERNKKIKLKTEYHLHQK